MPRRVQAGAGIGRAVEGTGDRELQALDGEEKSTETAAKGIKWAYDQKRKATASRPPVPPPSNANAVTGFSMIGAAPPLAMVTASSSKSTLAAPIALISPVKSLASAPPLSSTTPSDSSPPKPAAPNSPPSNNSSPGSAYNPSPSLQYASLTLPTDAALPLPDHAAIWLPAHAALPLPAFPQPAHAVFPAPSHAAFPAPSLAAPPLSDYEKGVRELLQFRDESTGGWHQLVGWYFQESDRSPSDVIGPPLEMPAPAPCGWERDARKLDILEKDKTAADIWESPVPGSLVAKVWDQVKESPQKRLMFEEAIRRWANSHNGELRQVLQKACFTKDLWTEDWTTMGNLKAMEEGPDKVRLLAQAEAESPRYYKRCMGDKTCGRKRTHSEDTDVKIVQTREEEVERVRKHQTLNPTRGRPTQFHAVPLEERAVDSNGNRLPWALEWHSDHTNCQHRKRKPEEKGSFGTYSGREGSISNRHTKRLRTDSSTVDAFGRANEHSLRKAEEAKLLSIASGEAHDDGSTKPRDPPRSTIKEPAQVILYGYSPATLWAAVSFYETASLGMVCEDYDREPPSELRKYSNLPSAACRVRPRALTRAESVLARRYRGGDCWIKVTFDSAEAAERAIDHSPHLLQGHWVYAEEFHGAGPEVDEPIPLREEHRREGRPRAPRRAVRPSTKLGQSVRTNRINSRRGANTSLRSLASNTTTEARAQPGTGASTPFLATATASTGEHRNPHMDKPPVTTNPTTNNNNNNNVTNTGGQAASLQPPPPPLASDPRFFTHFPTVPRTVLRPSHEAFLNHPSWYEEILMRLNSASWIPEMAGNGVPRLDNGEFDWAGANLYWKFFYWLDSHFGTNFCAMREE